MDSMKPLFEDNAPEDAEKFISELSRQVSNNIDYIKQQLFGPCRSIARNKRRAGQKWLKPLRSGGK